MMLLKVLNVREKKWKEKRRKIGLLPVRLMKNLVPVIVFYSSLAVRCLLRLLNLILSVSAACLVAFAHLKPILRISFFLFNLFMFGVLKRIDKFIYKKTPTDSLIKM